MNAYLPTIRLIRDQETLSAVERAALLDAHTAVRPSHVVTKGTEIIGALGIGSLPMVTYWMDSQKAKGRDCLAALQFCENLVAGTGGTALCLPVPESSPLYPYARLMPLQDFGLMRFFVKEL